MMIVQRKVTVTLLTYTYTYVCMYSMYVINKQFITQLCTTYIHSSYMLHLYTQLHTSYRYIFLNCVIEHTTQVCIYICLYIRIINAIKACSSYTYISQSCIYTNYEQYYIQYIKAKKRISFIEQEKLEAADFTVYSDGQAANFRNDLLEIISERSDKG